MKDVESFSLDELQEAEKHAFYIKAIKKVAKVYVCGDCNQSFTQACHIMYK